VGLSDRERTWLEFADQFEQRFVNQGLYENRTIEQSLDIAWELLAMLPEDDLIRIREEYIKEFHPTYTREG